MLPRLYFVVPCFNEEEVLPSTIEKLLQKLNQLKEDKKVSLDSGLFFVDDGSKDHTWSLIEMCSKEHEEAKGISLNQNYGHQIALYAGLVEGKELCDVSISIDADGQQSLDVVEEMLEEYGKGNEVVCAIRTNRTSDSFWKKSTALLFYSLMKCFGYSILRNHADYRLMSSSAIDLLEKMDKNTIFLRGEVLELPVKITSLFYECKEREKGESKYSLKKMIGLALDGFLMHGPFPFLVMGIVGLVFLFIGGKRLWVFLLFGMVSVLWSGIGLIHNLKKDKTTYIIRKRV